MTLAAALQRRLASLTLPQAARLAEQAARLRDPHAEIGGDMPLAEEPLRFVASDRMAMPLGDLADVEEDAGQLRVTANLLGLAGATPALPAYYSEVQLQRRRLRDRSMAGFLNIFDHRALSFFYRAARKYNWLLGFERETPPGSDPVSRLLLALAGFATPASRDRLSFDELALAPLAGRLGDTRRSAATLAAALRRACGLDVRIVEAEPCWLALPPEEQTRLGAAGRFARLGGSDAAGLGLADAALLGASVLDIQHRYAVEIGPLSYDDLQRFCAAQGPRMRIAEVCRLVGGVAHRPLLRLGIRAADIPALRLGTGDAPAMLARTAWLGTPGPPGRIVEDCAIPLEGH